MNTFEIKIALPGVKEITGLTVADVVYVNLTPHTLNMVDTNGGSFDIPPSGLVARLEELEDGDDVILGGIVGLPAPAPKVTYVVARPLAVALALRGQPRHDVRVVRTLVRDDKGVIRGAKGFALIR